MAWTVLKWTWRIAVAIFYLMLIWYILSQLHGRPETVIVPILGMLYVGVRGIGIGVGSGLILQARSLDSLQKQIRALSDPEYRRDPEETEEIAKQFASLNGQMLIDPPSPVKAGWVGMFLICSR